MSFQWNSLTNRYSGDLISRIWLCHKLRKQPEVQSHHQTAIWTCDSYRNKKEQRRRWQTGKWNMPQLWWIFRNRIANEIDLSSNNRPMSNVNASFESQFSTFCGSAIVVFALSLSGDFQCICNSNICPIYHRLRDIHSKNSMSLILTFRIGQGQT